jgi:CubicO group peptidase (beta-lactamase class C family)
MSGLLPFPLPDASPAALGLDPERLERLCLAVEADVKAGRHPGAQVALARHGRLALFRTFGEARRGVPAGEDTLWLLYSNTKVITAAGMWALMEDGALALSDPVARHLPGFEAHGKGAITLADLLTHQAGFPSAQVPAEVWEDGGLLRRVVCDFRLEWPTGSRVSYHPAAAHWALAAVIRAVTGEDHRAYLWRRVLAPLGLQDEVYVGLPPAQHGAPPTCTTRTGTRASRNARRPTARPGCRAAAATRRPAHGGRSTSASGGRRADPVAADGAIRAARPHRRARGRGPRRGECIAPSARTGAAAGLYPRPRARCASRQPSAMAASASSYCWGDPDSGLSFAFLSNTRQDEDFHLARMDRLSNLAHAAIRPG